LRDDKRFTYIKISTEEDWPRVFLTRKLEKSGRYFGPFTSVEAVRETLKIIRKIWPYRSCARLPKKTCLYYRIGKCPGVCEKRISRGEYREVIKQIGLFLEGRKNGLIKKLEVITAKATAVAVATARQAGQAGQGSKKLERILKNTKTQKHKNTNNYGEELSVIKYQLLNIKKVLASANIISLGDKYAADVIELAKILELPKVPERIEGYDISNIFGKEAVGSMVVFSGGEPDKGQYRKFKIRIGPAFASSAAKAIEDKEASAGKQGDVQMLSHVLERRFRHSIFPLPLTPCLRPACAGRRQAPPLRSSPQLRSGQARERGAI